MKAILGLSIQGVTLYYAASEYGGPGILIYLFASLGTFIATRSTFHHDH